MSIKSVVPVLVPASLAKGGKWMGPILKLQVPGLAVTWGLFAPRASVGYVTHAMAESWEAKNIDWRSRSMENLARMSKILAPQSLTSSDGRVSGLILNHEDGLGPSRLLLNGAIEEHFPEGYECAVPDRTIGIAVSKRMTAAERKEVTAFVAGCYKAAKEPLLGKFFSPRLLQARAKPRLSRRSS